MKKVDSSCLHEETIKRFANAKKAPSNLKLIIFAFTRTGSTNLVEILNVHPKIKLAHEPFHPVKENELSTKYDVTDARSLKNALNDIFARCNGFKHIENQFSVDINKVLLKQKGVKIIFLTRKNHLRRAVSEEMSNQTQVWHTFEKKESHVGFSNLPIHIISNKIVRCIYEIKLYRKYLVKNKADFLEIYYEDLFGELKNETQKISYLKKIILFLGVPFFNEEYLKVVKSILNPENSRLNGDDTYLKIPNRWELETKFGGCEYGHLFSYGKFPDGLEK